MQPAVNEQAESVDFQQTGVPAAAAGKHCKPGRRHAVFPSAGVFIY
jgi:hypothetical protein